MKIVLRNNNKTNYTIRRFNGVQLTIPSNDYAIFDAYNQNELNYWNSVNAESVGLTVITNNTIVKRIEQIVQRKREQSNKTSTTSTPIINNKDVETSNKINDNKSNVTNNTNIIDKNNTSIVKEEKKTETTNIQSTNMENTKVTDKSSTSTSKSVESKKDFTKDELSMMTKEQLIEILNKKGIKYAKNSTTNTLIKLILG